MNCNVTEIGKTLAQEVQYKFFLLNGSQKKKFQGSKFFTKMEKILAQEVQIIFFTKRQ